MKIIGKNRVQRGSASTEAVIATPAFIALILSAMELIVISWKALTLQLIANEAARSYASWSACETIDPPVWRWRDCRNHSGEADWVLKEAQSSIYQELAPRYALKMTETDTTVTVDTLMDNRAPDVCGNMEAVPGTGDGRGRMIRLSITHQADLLGLGLFRVPLIGEATAIMEPFERL